MLKINEHILPLSKARSGKKLRKFSGVTIHETGNPSKGSDAAAHDKYLHINGGKNYQVSYHYVVDDKQAFHLIPNNEVAWHAGDGASGKGNCETIAIEICINPEGNFNTSMKNAAYLTSKILLSNNIKKIIDGTKDKLNGNIFQHNTFSSYRKNCPENIRDKGLWQSFLDTVEQNLLNTSCNNFVVGSIVNIIGRQYVTGQIISSWAKNIPHTISKIQGNKALLGAVNGINSWVYLNDIALL